MNNWRLTVTGAYGRDYKTAAAAVADWLAGKDFLILTPGYHSYINLADARYQSVPENDIRIRFNAKEDYVDIEATSGRILGGSGESMECHLEQP